MKTKRFCSIKANVEGGIGPSNPEDKDVFHSVLKKCSYKFVKFTLNLLLHSGYLVSHTIPLLRKSSVLKGIYLRKRFFFLLITNRELLYLHGGPCGNDYEELK